MPRYAPPAPPPALRFEQRVHAFPCSPGWTGLRLKEVLRLVLPGLPSRAAVMIVSNGLVRAGARVLDDLDAPVPEGEPLSIDLRHGARGERSRHATRIVDRIRVLHNDDDIVVLSKAAGVVVQPDEEEAPPKKPIRGRGKPRARVEHSPPVIELLKHYWRARRERIDNPTLVHRLDKETSGLMVVARRLPAARHLQRQAASRRMERHYVAIVFGRVAEDHGTWKSHIGIGGDGYRQNVAPESPGSQEAITHYSVRRRLPGATALELRLETGRTHQIRVHCAEAGHPVLGDHVYMTLACHRHARLVAALRALPRQPRMMLHADRLKFQHPITERWLTFRDDLPESFAELIGDEGTGMRDEG